MEIWREQLEVNVLGQVAVTKAALPFVQAAGGRIVFIGSIGGKVATMLMGPYIASKFAIEPIGESLRERAAPVGPSACRRSSLGRSRFPSGTRPGIRLTGWSGRCRRRPGPGTPGTSSDPQGYRDAGPAKREPGQGRCRGLAQRCSPRSQRPATWSEPTPGCKPCWSAGCPVGRRKRSSAGSPGRRLTMATNEVRAGCPRSP